MSKRKVVVTRCPIGSASEIALQKGWLKRAYDEAGADLVLLQNMEKKEHIKHYTQQAPLVFREGGNIPPIWAQSIGNKTKLIGMTSINQSHAILVRNDSHITDVKQLKGKKLSIPNFNVQRVDFWKAMVLRGYETVLNSYGIDKSEVNFINLHIEEKNKAKSVGNDGKFIFEFHKPRNTVLQHKEEIEALNKGEIDAFFAHGALVYEIEDKGLARVLIDISKTNLLKVNNVYPSVITVNEEFSENNRDLVVIYMKEILRAAKWAKNNKDEVVEICARGQYGTSIGEILVSREKNFNYKFEPCFSKENIDNLRSQKDFLLKKGFIKKDFSIDKWIDKSFLEEAKKDL
ncbi:ABC transporter substrate-binding protein [Clostridium sp. JNZ X4-2]